MENDILITYASRYGSTAEIALKITEVIAGEGLNADISEVNEVHNLQQYGAVVLGSAVYLGKWRKDAIRFVKMFEKDLSERKVWIFSTGPTGKGDPVKLLEGWDMPTSLKPAVERIKPEDIAVFHGVLDMDKLNNIHRYMVKKIKAPVGDYRDWEQVSQWAKKIASRLKE
ncbi:MAG: flavodoxin domain-containing protein [Bacteroidales bacterium]|nr:flavodoxin domain-containing protein [Bacteroidales bacterium]